MKTSFELIVFSNVYDCRKRKKARTTTLFGLMVNYCAPGIFAVYYSSFG